MHCTQKKPQRGIGLLELMLSLLVISVLIVSILSYYRISNTAQKVSSTLHLMSGLIVASEAWFETYHSFTPNNQASISIQALSELGKLPKNICERGEDCSVNMMNPWGGNVNVLPKDETHIQILLTGLPISGQKKGICQQLSDLLRGKVSSDCSRSDEGIYMAIYPSE